MQTFNSKVKNNKMETPYPFPFLLPKSSTISNFLVFIFNSLFLLLKTVNDT